MTIEQFTNALRAEPFRPFVLHVAGGKQYPVSDAEMATRTPSGKTVVVVAGEESFAVLDSSWIEAITYQEAPEHAAGERYAES